MKTKLAFFTKLTVAGLDRCRCRTLDAMAFRRSCLSQVSPGTCSLYCCSRDHCYGSPLVVDAADWRADRAAGYLWLVRPAARGNSSPDSSRGRRQVRRRDMDWRATSNRCPCGDRYRRPGCNCPKLPTQWELRADSAKMACRLFGGIFVLMGIGNPSMNRAWYLGPMLLHTGDHVFHLVLGALFLSMGLLSGRALRFHRIQQVGS